jgi:hypothetical protein
MLCGHALGQFQHKKTRLTRMNTLCGDVMQRCFQNKKASKTIDFTSVFQFGAGGRTRTGTTFKVP